MNPESRIMQRFVILDRDGVIIEDRDHLTKAELVELIPGAAAAIRELSQGGFGVVVVTNQSVIGRGWLDEAGLHAIHDRMNNLLASEGATLDGIFVCPHTSEDGCICRKPAVGLMEQAKSQHDFLAEESFVVGDKTSDIEFGRRAGATTILVRTGYGRNVEAEGNHSAHHVVDDLSEAAGLIQKLSTQ